MQKKTIDQLRQEAREQLAEGRADETDVHFSSFEWLVKQMQFWQSWYLKRSQPRNYFRITRIIPPGYQENPHAWICRFQVWCKAELIIDDRITGETFDKISKMEGWNVDIYKLEFTTYIRRPYNVK